jgi:hypothetical protein
MEPGLWTSSPPIMCINNQWQIKLGSSAYFLRVMFEIFDGNSLYVRQRRQAATKDEDLNCGHTVLRW